MLGGRADAARGPNPTVRGSGTSAGEAELITPGGSRVRRMGWFTGGKEPNAATSLIPRTANNHTTRNRTFGIVGSLAVGAGVAVTLYKEVFESTNELHGEFLKILTPTVIDAIPAAIGVAVTWCVTKKTTTNERDSSTSVVSSPAVVEREMDVGAHGSTRTSDTSYITLPMSDDQRASEIRRPSTIGSE